MCLMPLSPRRPRRHGAGRAWKRVPINKTKCCANRPTACRDYMHKLSRANNFLEVVPIHTEFMQSQLGFMGEQIKSLGEIYTKAAAEVLNASLQNAIRELTPSIIPPSVR